MKKIIIALVFLFTLNLSLSLADNPVNSSNYNRTNLLKSPVKSKKVFLGVDIGVTFGNYTEVRISPLLGYKFTPQIAGGLKFVYRHSWDKAFENTPNQTTIQTNSYGGNAFIQYNPITEFYLKVEYSYQSYKNSTTQNTSENTGVPFLFLGLGYTKYISSNVFFNGGVKVDVLNSINSPFENFTPFFDAGIGVEI